MLSLIPSHKEANTKLVLHAKVLLEETNDAMTIRSSSGDNHVVILAVSLFWKFKQRAILRDGHVRYLV